MIISGGRDKTRLLIQAGTVFVMIIASMFIYHLSMSEQEKGVGKRSSAVASPLLSPSEIDGKDGSDMKTCNPDSNTGSARLKDIICRGEKDFPGTLGVLYYDTASGEKVTLNVDTVFESASLVKILIMAKIFQDIETGRISADKELELKDSYKVGGSGILKDEKNGSLWKVSELVDLMITESDNTATDMLIDLAGMESIEEYGRFLGLKNTTLRRKIYDFPAIDQGRDNLTTPADMFTLLLEMCDGEKIPESSCRKMSEILQAQKKNDMIPRLLPEGVLCAHKTGGLTGFLHDCAVIYPEKDSQPYILVLMGKDVTDDGRAGGIYSSISLEIFNELYPGSDSGKKM